MKKKRYLNLAAAVILAGAANRSAWAQFAPPPGSVSLPTTGVIQLSNEPTPAATNGVVHVSNDSLPAATSQVPASLPPVEVPRVGTTDCGTACNGCPQADRPSFWSRCKHTLHEWFADRTDYVPLGDFVYQQGRTQVANGEAALMILYDYDFDLNADGTPSDRLSPRGRRQLAKIASMLPRNFFPVVIESVPTSAEVDGRRRATVVTEIARGGFNIPQERVVIAIPTVNGLRGPEAEIHYRNLLNFTRERRAAQERAILGTIPGAGAAGGGLGVGTAAAGGIIP